MKRGFLLPRGGAKPSPAAAAARSPPPPPVAPRPPPAFTGEVVERDCSRPPAPAAPSAGAGARASKFMQRLAAQR
jgi:hypothetical protein